MIIKSHIRGGYRSAADYMKDIGQNESSRLVEIGVAGATTLDEAFQAMWGAACDSRVKKPLHHISINPQKHERLSDEQVRQIAERCEQLYGYHPHQHQRVVVEHIKEGRQHFHVIWNRVSLETGKAVWPGHHWLKSRHVARMMEAELGLERPPGRRMDKRARSGTGANHPLGFACPARPTGANALARYAQKGLGAGSPQSRRPALPSSQQSKTIQPALQPALSPLNAVSMEVWGGMGEEQRRDLEAAIKGRISWRQYFLKWGKGGLTL